MCVLILYMMSHENVFSYTQNNIIVKNRLRLTSLVRIADNALNLKETYLQIIDTKADRYSVTL